MDTKCPVDDIYHISRAFINFDLLKKKVKNQGAYSTQIYVELWGNIRWYMSIKLKIIHHHNG